jgi:hypothetical protein
MKRAVSHSQITLWELFRIQDQVAANVVQSFALAQSAAGRMKEANFGFTAPSAIRRK